MIQKKIDSLQLLRAIAVGFVVFIHAAHFGVPIISSHNPTDNFYNLKTWGTIGVDLFFTISGFIMALVVPAYFKPGGWKTFFAKRMIRIIPLYYLLSLSDLLFSIFIKHESVNFRVIIKSLIFFPLFDNVKFVTPLLTVGWSLSYEMYFYTLIGILLVFAKNMYKILLALIFVLGIVGFAIDPINPLLKFLMSPLLIEFGLGIICGMTYKKINASPIGIGTKQIIASIFIITGLSLMCSTIFLPVEQEIHGAAAIENSNLVAFHRVLIWGIPCAIFLLGTTLVEGSFNMKIPGPVILAGDASYSCYLIHMKIFPLIAFLFKYLSFGPLLYLSVVIPISLAVSVVFYKIVEKPLITAIDKLLHYRTPIIMK